MRSVIIIVTGLFLPACFWGFPPRSRPQSVPEIVSGEQMTYESSSFQTGVDGDSATYGHDTTAKYRGRELTQNEFSMLVDPDYPAKAKKYDTLRSACARGNVFKYISAFTIIGGVVAYPSLGEKTDDTTRLFISGGIVAGGLAIGALAYLIGGNRCSEVNEMADMMQAERFDDTNLIGTSAGQREVDAFNERYGLKKPAPPETHPTEEAVEDPPAVE